MKQLFTKAGLAAAVLLCAGTSMAQSAKDTIPEFKPSGKLWGYVFGDMSFKGSADTLRTNSNQYDRMKANTNLFQFRRIYLGYNYDISRKFSAEFLLAAEDDFQAGSLGQASNGDVLADNKFAPYIKLANLRWKNLWNGTDLVVGQSPTPTFAKNGSGMASEEVWGYRSIERTITDDRRSGSFDMGVALQGRFDHEGRFGYTAMVGNGNGDKPENDNYKWFYGDIWGKFFGGKLVVDLYQDYYRMNWGTFVKGNNGPRYNDRNMTKLFAAYSTKQLTVGVEAYMNTLMGDLTVNSYDGNTYYRTTKAMGISAFVRGQIIENKLGFFARYDTYDPSLNLKSTIDDKALRLKSYAEGVSQYDPSNKEQFVTFGLDFTPMKNVHIMPNLWINTYKSSLNAGDVNPNSPASAPVKYGAMNGASNNIFGPTGTDAVYRITFYYIYGK